VQWWARWARAAAAVLVRHRGRAGQRRVVQCLRAWRARAWDVRRFAQGLLASGDRRVLVLCWSGWGRLVRMLRRRRSGVTGLSDRGVYRATWRSWAAVVWGRLDDPVERMLETGWWFRRWQAVAKDSRTRAALISKSLSTCREQDRVMEKIAKRQFARHLLQWVCAMWREVVSCSRGQVAQQLEDRVVHLFVRRRVFHHWWIEYRREVLKREALERAARARQVALDVDIHLEAILRGSRPGKRL